MTEILLSDNVMTSYDIADITGKQHQHVTRDIRVILEQGVDQSNFGLVSYTTDNGQIRNYYKLTKKGSLLLASGYSALLREKIIDRWEYLEKKNKFNTPKTFAEALMLAATQAKQLEEQQIQLEVQAPKVDYYDKALSSESLFTINSIAMCLGMSAIRLNQELFRLHIQYKQGPVWILTSPYKDKGLARIIDRMYTTHDGDTASKPQMKWTERGKEFILNLRKEGKL